MNRVFVKTLKWRRVVAVSSVHDESVKVRRFLRLFQISSNWSPLVDKGWQLPLWFLLFSSSFPKSACPTQALRASLMHFAIFKFFSNLNTWGRTWKCAPMTDRFLPQGKQNSFMLISTYLDQTRLVNKDWLSRKRWVWWRSYSTTLAAKYRNRSDFWLVQMKLISLCKRH